MKLTNNYTIALQPKKIKISKSNTFTNYPIKSGTKDVFFSGKQYPSGYYSDKEIAYAKEFLGSEGWEQKIIDDEYSKIESSKKETSDLRCMVELATCFIPALIEMGVTTQKAKKNAKPIIKNVRELMFDLYNEKLQEIEARKKELAKENFERAILLKTQDRLKTEYLDNVKEKNLKLIPTAIMLESGNKDQRLNAIKWLKEHSTDRFIEFSHNGKENDTIYRLESELDYAKTRYEASGQRTILYIDGFDKLLDINGENTAHMKGFMSDISKDSEPITIIFETDDSSSFANPFKGNFTRIPTQIKLEKAPLEDMSKKTNGQTPQEIELEDLRNSSKAKVEDTNTYNDYDDGPTMMEDLIDFNNRYN